MLKCMPLIWFDIYGPMDIREIEESRNTTIKLYIFMINGERYALNRKNDIVQIINEQEIIIEEGLKDYLIFKCSQFCDRKVKIYSGYKKIMEDIEKEGDK